MTCLLYHTPGTCSRVALNALEEISLPYKEQCIALHRGEQYEVPFKNINPKSKVPVLVDDDVTITELPAMLYHLASAYPGKGLLPLGRGGLPDLVGLSDLIWLAGALHPALGRMFRPPAYSALDPAGVKQMASDELATYAKGISARVSEAGWWYGEHWSIVDAFVTWIYSVAGQCDFPLQAFPALVEHRRRVEVRPSFSRARALELAVADREDLVMPSGFTL